jgi:L-seryl-tRNA(Ser) seleniumtransferase
MLSSSEQTLQKRGKIWLADLQKRIPNGNWQLEPTTCFIGGGVAPMRGLPSFAVSLTPPRTSADTLARQLRQSNPPVVARIEEERILFELRTLQPEEEKIITQTLEMLLTAESGMNKIKRS